MSKADLTTTYLFAFEKGKESAQAEIKEAKKEAYKEGYKQALADLMEAIKPEIIEIPGDTYTRDLIYIEIDDLQKIAEDLKK